MHLLELWYEGGRRCGNGSLSFLLAGGRKRRWTFLRADESGEEILRLIAVVCCGVPFLNRLAFDWGSLVRVGDRLRVTAMVELHAPRDRRPGGRRILGLEVTENGSIRSLGPAEFRMVPRSIQRRRKLPLGATGIRPCLHLAYGDLSAVRLHQVPVQRAFEDPWFRRRRVASLFGPREVVTAPEAFLDRLLYRCQKGRVPANALRERLDERFQARLGLRLDAVRGITAVEEASFPERVALLVIDAVRHAGDASPHDKDPLRREGVLTLHRPETWCRPTILDTMLALLDDLFPRMQFIVTLAPRSARRVPAHLASGELAAPAAAPRKIVRRIAMPRGTVALVQIDGRLPNLALMKVARHLKNLGRRVGLFRPGEMPPDGIGEIWASAIFYSPSTTKKVDTLRQRFGPALTLGGSGVDLALRLPPEIEALTADYTLYPELDGVAVGFLTRGCPGRCAFCVVPRKEGPVRRVSDIDTLTEGGRRQRLILLDDNLLAHREADAILEELVRWRLEVNFNQTLDILRVTPDRARLLRKIQARNVRFTRPCYHFSLNDSLRLEAISRAYALLEFTSADHVEFICMYGRDTTLAEDVERFRFLRSLPGAYVFVQEYLPPLNAPAVSAPPFFDRRADRLIQDLVGICFPENMKSMEKYYRWLSEVYYREFGHLHGPLVDTIFRYNQRDRKGLYTARHPRRGGRS